jgi:hypothetical protein
MYIGNKRGKYMQTKLNDFQKYNKKSSHNKFKYLVIGIFILLSLFTAKAVFAETNEPEIGNLDLIFDKGIYSLMQDTSTKIGFTIVNNNPVVAKIRVWADCEDEDELECNYSKRYTLPGNSELTDSFYVSALDESDSKVTVYIKLLNSEDQDTEEFRTDIEVTEDEEDGEFSVDLSTTNVCIGRTNTITLDIENDYSDGLYGIYLSSPKLVISSEYSNPVYLRDEKEIDYSVIVSNNATDGEEFDLTLRIENEEIKIIKEFSLYAEDCPEPNNDFTVSGSASTTQNISKGQSKTLSYTLKNISNTNRTFYISEDNVNSEIKVDISSRQFNLDPNQSKNIVFTFTVSDKIISGTYNLKLNFFDGLKSISKNVKLVVNPKFDFKIENLSESNLNLAIGKTIQIMILLKNTGDVKENITIELNPNNDLEATTQDSRITVDKHNNEYVTIYVSAGDFTQLGLSSLNVKINGTSNNFSEELDYIINVVKISEPLNIELLAYPKTLSVEINSSKEFEITLRNKGNKITINKIELTNIPQNIDLVVDQTITLNPGETKTLSAKINIGDIPKEDIEAELRFVSNNGEVLEQPILLKLTEDVEKDKSQSKLLGFLTLRNSVWGGIIFICLLIMLFFILGIFKIKRN